MSFFTKNQAPTASSPPFDNYGAGSGSSSGVVCPHAIEDDVQTMSTYSNDDADANSTEASVSSSTSSASCTGIVDFRKDGVPFPLKLHRLLDTAEMMGFDDIIAWMPDGLSFRIFDKLQLEEKVMPHYFSSTKFKSFQRTLNLWSFETSKKAAEQHEHGCRYHPLFVRGRPELCYQMKRVRVKRNNTTSKLGEEQKAVLSATGHGEKGRPRIIIPSSQQPPPAPQENIDELHSTEDDAPRTTFTQQLLLSALLESSRPQPYIQAGCEDYALSSAAASFSRRIPPLKDDQHMLQAKRTCELILGLGSTPSFKAARSCFRPSPGMGGNLSDLNGPVLAHLLGSSSSLLESTLPRAPASNSLVGLAPAASHFCPMPPVLVPPLDMANVRRLAASMLLAAIALADSSKRGQEERVVKGERC